MKPMQENQATKIQALFIIEFIAQHNLALENYSNIVTFLKELFPDKE